MCLARANDFEQMCHDMNQTQTAMCGLDAAAAGGFVGLGASIVFRSPLFGFLAGTVVGGPLLLSCDELNQNVAAGCRVQGQNMRDEC